MNWVVGLADLPADVVEGVIRVLTVDRDDLAQVHDMVEQIHIERLREAPIDLHDVSRTWVERNLRAEP